MNKLFTSFVVALGISASPLAEEARLSALEEVVLESKKTNDFMPVWDLFVNTQFYVVTIPLDSGDKTSDFKFSIFQSLETENQPVVIISEDLSRLDRNSSSDKAIKVSGAKLIQLLNAEVGILLALADGGFGLPKEQVQWLRASIQPTH